jgi:hypothetical protein
MRVKLPPSLPQLTCSKSRKNPRRLQTQQKLPNGSQEGNRDTQVKPVKALGELTDTNSSDLKNVPTVAV